MQGVPLARGVQALDHVALQLREVSLVKHRNPSDLIEKGELRIVRGVLPLARGVQALDHVALQLRQVSLVKQGNSSDWIGKRRTENSDTKL